MKRFELDINESSWEDNLSLAPETAGIYFAYACYRGEAESGWFSGPLVYIGEASNLRQRLSDHYALRDNHDGLAARYEKIWYTYARYAGSESDRRWCEAALIFKHKPPQNDQNVQSFGYATTEIVLRGETRGLVPTFVIAE